MNDSAPWWQSFFRGRWGELQAGGFPPERTRLEVDFVVQSLALARGERILDVPCGERKTCASPGEWPDLSATADAF